MKQRNENDRSLNRNENSTVKFSFLNYVAEGLWVRVLWFALLGPSILDMRRQVPQLCTLAGTLAKRNETKRNENETTRVKNGIPGNQNKLLPNRNEKQNGPKRFGLNTKLKNEETQR